MKKIRNSKNQIYCSCPYIDKIQQIIDGKSNLFECEEILELNQTLEIVRGINQALREGNKGEDIYYKNYIPYNISAVFKKIKSMFVNDVEKINDVIKLYY